MHDHSTTLGRILRRPDGTEWTVNEDLPDTAWVVWVNDPGHNEWVWHASEKHARYLAKMSADAGRNTSVDHAPMDFALVHLAKELDEHQNSYAVGFCGSNGCIMRPHGV